ncbi:MAG: 6,7-dimethyl-8-ribityllumazine synthase [Pseudomonadota bacterium]
MSSVQRVAPSLEAEGLRMAVVVSRFNQDITRRLEAACLAALQQAGVAEDDIVVFSVPGALEIPLVLAQLAETGQFDGLIALGAVVRGETYHFEVVSNESAAGIARVSHDLQVPIANGVLTTDTDAQALARADEKGRDCALAAIEMANLMLAIDEQFGSDDDQ